MASETDGPAEEVSAEPDESPEVTDEGFAHFYQGQIVINHIHDKIGQASFGISGSRPESRRTSGPVPAYEMTEARTCFVRHDVYDSAGERLEIDYFLALVGGPGTGKRTAALNLLDGVLGGRDIVELSPAYTLEKLAAREYRRGHGYLLCGWPKDDVDEGVADFHVREIRRRVRDARAYLVITARETSLPTGDQVLWSPAPARDILLAHQVTQEVADIAANRITPDHAMADVVALARELSRGTSLNEALDGLESAGRRDVVAWFGQPRTRGEIFEMAAMAFAARVPEREFETLHARLESIAGFGEEKVESISGDDLMPTRHRLKEDALFSLSQGRRLEFRVEGHRIHVMRELQQTQGMRLWDPVTEWLHECAALRAPLTQLEIARGVAILALVTDYPYVESTFLTPWAAGEGIMRSQAAAAMAISWLCLDETTRPQALRTVNWWANSSVVRLRFTAMLAYSGELGIRFPLEAVRLLWSQIRESGGRARYAESALARLFTSLTEATGNALPMLDWLVRQITNDKRVGRVIDPLLRAINGLLAARADGYGVPAATAHLRSRPDSSGPLAGLWARVLVNRPHRKRALAALYDTVCAFDEKDEEDRERVRALFAALVAALPAHERPPLARDLRAYAVSHDTEESRLEILLSLLRVFLHPAAISPDPIGRRS
ncbi:hypothetical protein [Herbidospora sp. NBRC 101105]|uniref:hypothetical protein n=1 Tax=Herbidospora sp. NBRC 101105 TaxID=3032195 RepID=UPI0024A59CAB|nr:hypothetical protein [Herbidospora sp. NBRC 101105]GLX95214.1 hypothetical protein Hesp01_31640 [Herbidospora sp. NBRC 101105]